jgi:hypothetical protein
MYDDEIDGGTPCEHIFEQSTEIIRAYNFDLCSMVITHGQNGLFIEGFSGRYNVCFNAICDWLSSSDPIYDDFKSACKISVSACIHFWNEELNHAVMERNWAAVAAIKTILADIMKSMPKGLRENMLADLAPEDAETKTKNQQLEIQKKTLSVLKGTGNN